MATHPIFSNPEPIVTDGRTLDEIYDDIMGLIAQGHTRGSLRLHAGRPDLPKQGWSKRRTIGGWLESRLRPGDALYGVRVV
jgi:hypothetical protein